MSIELLTSKEAFEQAIKENEACLLLKHSLTCPISGEAKDEYEKFQASTDLPMYIIHVQDQRDVSNYVEQYFNIKHESPQVFYIKNGQVVFHTSHWDITENKLKEKVK
ncbi:bacillithiol system redox-active protein YtxJ [Bacillaceae bacterium W0354]